jgi:hypothetical protein
MKGRLRGRAGIFPNGRRQERANFRPECRRIFFAAEQK